MSTAQQFFDHESLAVSRSGAPSTAHTVAIIGGGFSGTVLAAALLRHALTPTRVFLIERNARIGRGAAYAAADYPYLLNVPAARMSVNADDPLEFLRFAQRTFPYVTGNDFLPRALYGEYLEYVLTDAEYAAPLQVNLTRVHAQAQRVTPFGQRLCVQLDSGASIFADDVVLALGNPPPAELPDAQALRGHPAYFDNPWSLRKTFDAAQSVLIIGTGLSMADVVLKLTDDEHSMPQLHAISRHGLLPLAQSAAHGAPPQQAQSLLSVNSTRALLAAVRRLSKQLQRDGGDWRDLINGVRGIAPRLWRQLPADERRRFMRHVQSYWDVCRHRLPQEVLEHLDYVRQTGKLHIAAGRIQSLRAIGEHIAVEWRARGARIAQTMTVDAVINATGPDYRIDRSRDALTKKLLVEGWISPHPTGVGLRTGAQGAVIGRDGSEHRHLFYLGPLLRAEHWETTAAAELRGHAEQLVHHLLEKRYRAQAAFA